MPKNLLHLAICASLLLHALILAGSGKWTRQRTDSQTPYRLHLRLSAPAEWHQPVLPERQFVPPAHLTGGATQPTPLRQEGRVTPPAMLMPADDGKRVSPPPLNQEDLRQQARQLSLERAETDVLRRRPPDETAPLPDLIDRPILDALARRIGRPLTALEETTLPDGARRVRFSGGLCLDIPQHLPYGTENAFGPTLLVPKACAD